MKDKDINIYDYEKILFVDASGDDGFVFREKSGDGSTFTFVVSCLAINPEDFEHNCNILNNMKDALNIPRDSELKSTTLHRHRFAADAYKLLSDIKGDVFSLIAFKKELQNSEKQHHINLCDTSSKALSGLVHTFPVYAFSKEKVLPEGSRVLIVIDHLKQTEADAISESYNALGISNMIDYDVIYRDSKSEKFPLIQLADALCGSVRNYFEKNLTPLDIQRYCRICPNAPKPLCKQKKIHKLLNNVPFLERERIVLQLHKCPIMKEKLILFSIVPLPFELYRNYLYIDCSLGNRLKKRC